MDIEIKRRIQLRRYRNVVLAKNGENKMDEKTNEELLVLVKENRTLLSNLRSRRWHIISHTLGHNEELHSTTPKGMIEGKRGRNKQIISYLSQIIKDARVNSYKQLKYKV
jgi:hypothetical protein